MSHTIREQYDLTADKEALEADFNAMLDWLDNWDMKPCTSVYFGQEVNAILVRNWIDFRNSLSNTSGRYERRNLEEFVRDECEDFEFSEIQNRMTELSDGQLMAIARLFNEDILVEIGDTLAPVTQIQIVWQIGDVQSIRPDLTDQKASEVLQYADRHHNAEIGINWDVLRIHADHLFPEDEIAFNSEVVNSRYADSIIAGDPSQYDAIEVHGVRNINDPDDPDGTHYEVDDEDPELYSAYLHCVGGGIECVGDFSSHSLAMGYAHELSAQYQWRISSHCSYDN